MYAGRIVELADRNNLRDTAPPLYIGPDALDPRIDSGPAAGADPGQPPNLSTLPRGCPFAQRCRFAHRCRATEVALRESHPAI